MNKIEAEVPKQRSQYSDAKRPPVTRPSRNIFQRRESVLLNHDERNSVSLKEYLLAMRSVDHEMDDRQQAAIILRFELAERALELDHVEMLRRLDLLNHAHEDARQKEASFVNREVYESQIKDQNKWRDEVNSALSTRQGRSSVVFGVGGAVGGFVLTALFGLIMYFAKAMFSGLAR
jgi:hypothetical protein